MTDDGRILAFGSLALVALAGAGRRGQAARQAPRWLDQFHPEPIRPADGRYDDSQIWWGPGGPHENENYIEVIDEDRWQRTSFRVRQYTLLEPDEPPEFPEWLRQEVLVESEDFAAVAEHIRRVIPQTAEWAVSIGLAMFSEGRGVDDEIVTARDLPDPIPRRISFRDPNPGPVR
jgi:hypothetical protein